MCFIYHFKDHNQKLHWILPKKTLHLFLFLSYQIFCSHSEKRWNVKRWKCNLESTFKSWLCSLGSVYMYYFLQWQPLRPLNTNGRQTNLHILALMHFSFGFQTITWDFNCNCIACTVKYVQNQYKFNLNW